MSEDAVLIYLDTNAYARPFDDQTPSRIQGETDALLVIIEAIKTETLLLLSSDILQFEVQNILDEEKRTKVSQYLTLSTCHIEQTDDVLQLGKQIQHQCHTRSRDALHVASAILGDARYCISCDNTVTAMKHARCYRRLGKAFRHTYFSVMNPRRFVERLQQGDIV